MNQRELFFRHLAQTSESPLALEIERAEGVYLFDRQGRSYLDMISGISVSNVGHRHPKVLDAIQKQLDKYLHLMVYGEYIQTPQVQLATKIASLLPDPLDSVYLVNSGSEAVEGAMKLAKRVTGRPGMVSFQNAYHGSTQGCLSMLGNEEMRNAYRPLLPGIVRLPYNDLAALELIDDQIAAVVVEAVQGEAGAVVPGADFLVALRKKCSETGTLLILDEIQTGFGRTGSWFAFQHSGIVPDIVCMAKGLGGGMPIGAFAARKEHMALFMHNPVLGHITTFGGHPVSAAAALACIKVLEAEQLIERVEEKAQLIRRLLVHPEIKSVQGQGLLLAVEFDTFETNKQIIDRAIEKGVITDWFLFNSNSMRIAPPLTISESQIEIACETILSVI